LILSCDEKDRYKSHDKNNLKFYTQKKKLLLSMSPLTYGEEGERKIKGSKFYNIINQNAAQK